MSLDSLLPQRRSRTILFTSVLSDILFTMATIIGLYLLYLVWFTGVIAYFDQEKLASDFSFSQPEDASQIAKEMRENIPCLEEPKETKDMIGRVYIPKFGTNYVRNIVQGVDRYKVLDLQGYGHYNKTVMPGCIGNFAAAAHRGGYGESLARVQELKVGDSLIIRDLKNWFVYKITNYEIVGPENGEVIWPIPNLAGSFVAKDAEEKAKGELELKTDDKQEAHQRLLTFTTCHPRWGSTQRYIVYAKLDYYSPVVSGVPKELLDVGFKLKG